MLRDGKIELGMPSGVGVKLSGAESARSPLWSSDSKSSVGTSNLTV